MLSFFNRIFEIGDAHTTSNDFWSDFYKSSAQNVKKI